MRIFLVAFVLCSFSLFSEETAASFLEKPVPLNPTFVEKKISDYKAAHSGADYKAEDFYNLSLIYIQENKLDQAEESLHQAISLDPSFTLAKLQLGLLFFWKADFFKAQEWMQKVLIDLPCDKRALSGLEKIAHEWENEETSQNMALKIYRQLIGCLPDNADYLFYLGRLLLRMDQRQEAEEVLQKCLKIAPQYADASVQLGLLYFRQQKFARAEEIFQHFPKDLDAQTALARIAMQKEDYEKAKELLLRLVQKRPNDLDLHYMLAGLYYDQMEFKNSKKENQILLKYLGKDDQIYRNLFDIKSHTDPSLVFKSSYTAAKENDPSLNEPVVRDFYLYNTISVILPIFDRWRLDIQALSGFQKEIDIYPPEGTNYYVPYMGARVLSNWFFHQNWRWDLFCSVVRGWNVGHNVNYPFLNTTRIQPGTVLFYNHAGHFLVLDFHFDDFLIKDFARMESKYLTIKCLQGIYKYRFEQTFHPEIEGAIGGIFYDDSFHNVQNYQVLSLRLGPSWMSELFHPFYNFEHRGFAHLNQNYYSFKKQYLHVIGVKLNKEWPSGYYFELLYFHDWKFTYNLYQPIGSFVYVAAKQKLTANSVAGLIGYRFKDKFRFEAAGHYFRDTLPYRDWNVMGSLIWEL